MRNRVQGPAANGAADPALTPLAATAAIPPAPAGDLAEAERPHRLRRTAAVERLLWDLAQVAQALGISERTVKRMGAAGELPGMVRIGRRRLFDRRRLEGWIAEGCPPLTAGKRRSSTHR